MCDYIVGSGWFSDEYNKTAMGNETNKIQVYKII